MATKNQRSFELRFPVCLTKITIMWSQRKDSWCWELISRPHSRSEDSLQLRPLLSPVTSLEISTFAHLPSLSPYLYSFFPIDEVIFTNSHFIKTKNFINYKKRIADLPIPLLLLNGTPVYLILPLNLLNCDGKMHLEMGSTLWGSLLYRVMSTGHASALSQV